MHPFNICEKYPDLWHFIKITYILSFTFSTLIILNLIYLRIFSKQVFKDNKEKITNNQTFSNSLSLLIGKDLKDNSVYISEKGLYQNMLITGTIRFWKN